MCSRFTPDVLFFGREFKSPLLTRWDLSSDDENTQHLTNRSFWAQAYSNLKAVRARVARRYNANRTPHRYMLGDLVMYRKTLLALRHRMLASSY